MCISYSWEMSAYCLFSDPNRISGRGCMDGWMFSEASAVLQTLLLVASASRAQRVMGMHGKCSLHLGPIV